MKISVKVPALGESVTEATIGRWLKQNGDVVQLDEPICAVESDKATLDVTAEQAGQLHILIAEGETVAVGTVVAEIDTDAAPVKEARPTVPESSPVAPPKEKATIDDVEPRQPAPSLVSEAPKPAEKPVPMPPPAVVRTPGARTERREKMTTIRKTISARLLEAKQGTAMLTTFNEVDMTTIKNYRAQFNEMIEKKHGLKLGFMSFFTQACCIALQENPIVNAKIERDELVYYDYCDISIAVSTPRGLVTPVIRNAESLNLIEIEQEVARLAVKARENKITIDDMMGGTFTITNGGVFGSLLSTPIVNAPQSAILGMHTIQDRPVVREGQIVIRPMMFVALSYDHRLIDGKESVTFLIRVKELLEEPVRMLFDI